MPEPVVVHVFTDYACPWCYLGRARLQKLASELSFSIHTVHYQLSPDTPPEGREIAGYLRARGVNVQEASARLMALMDLEGLPWNVSPHRMAYNTQRAQELAAFAEANGVGEPIHDALFKAFQVDNVNVYELDVLVEIAVSVGLDAVAARTALEAQTFAATVARDQLTAREIGVTSVPTFVAGGRGVVGAQPLDALRQLVASAIVAA